MAYKEWTNQYNIGVKKFNDAHKVLFSYINDLHSGLLSGLGISEMGYILRGLVDYAIVHFKDEEKLMIKHSYPEYEAHKKEHDSLLEEVEMFYTEFLENKKAFSLELLSFLENWITNHILNTDMRYKTFFKVIAKNQE